MGKTVNTPIIIVVSRNKKLLNFVCLSILIIILMAGLWPFNVNPPNRVHWLPADPGIRIDGPGHLYGPGYLWQEVYNTPFTLELWLRPAQEPNNRLPHILSYWDGQRQEVFLLGQWKDALAIRIRTQNLKASRGYRERGCERILLKDQDVFLTLTSSRKETVIYYQGRPVKEIPGFFLLEDRGQNPGTVILGNSADGRHFWKGRVFGLAFYDRALSADEIAQNCSHWWMKDYQKLNSIPGLLALYPFAEGKGPWAADFTGQAGPFFIPDSFSPLKNMILEWPSREYMKRMSFYEDLAINVLGFIPLGFFFPLWLIFTTRLNSRKAFVLTFLIGSLVSLGIELAQVYLPGRDSSASDLVCNMVGTLIGLALLHWGPKNIILTARSFLA